MLLVGNLKNGEAAGSITTNTGDEDVKNGVNVDKGAYSANIGRYLENHAAYSIVTGYDSENYSKNSAVFGNNNKVGTPPDFMNLTNDGKTQYESTGWTRDMSIYGLNSDGFSGKTGNKDKLVFNPTIASDNLVSGFRNVITKATYSIISGKENNIDVATEGLVIAGRSNTIINEVKNSAIIGKGLTGYTAHSTQNIFGTYNKINAEADFIIGNGTNAENRKNAFEVYHDGRAKVYSAPIEDNDVVRKTELDELKNQIAELRATIEILKGQN